MSTNIRRWALASLAGLAAASLGGCKADEKYPNCKAFAYDDAGGEPRVLDEDATFDDCGHARVSGSVVDEPAVIDCALEQIAAGNAMKVSIERDPEAEEGESWVIYADEDALAMRWRNVRMDLTGGLDARVFQLDTDRVAECIDRGEADERFACLVELFETTEVVDTCMTKETQSS